MNAYLWNLEKCYRQTHTGQEERRKEMQRTDV